MVTKETLVSELKSLGLASGQKVLVHSSLSSFGHMQGGADTVIDAILEVIGENGTMLVPTLTGHEDLSAQNPPEFDPQTTPCWTGKIPETFRKRSNAIRSIHPTHSVAAIGASATWLTESHIHSITPCDEFSPYGRLAELTDSFILLIGVNHKSSTMFHYIEEVAGVDYHIQKGFVNSKIHTNGDTKFRQIMLHQYGTPRNFNIMEQIFIDQGIQQNTVIGNAEIRFVNAFKMVKATLNALRVDQTILCER